jgi:hypothetical protein
MAWSSLLAMNRAPLVVCRGLVVPRLVPLLDLAHGPRVAAGWHRCDHRPAAERT